MATPAEVANDMAMQAQYWLKRDKNISNTCNDAARLIRAYIAGQPVDGRTYHGLFGRLLKLSFRYQRSTMSVPDFDRARMTLQALNAKNSAK